MRLQVVSGTFGEKWLTSRFEYYRRLNSTGKTVWNPESYEKSQAKEMGMSSCTVPVDSFPVVVSRYVGPGRICFIDRETMWYNKRGRLMEDCTPSDKHVKKFVKANICPGSKGSPA